MTTKDLIAAIAKHRPGIFEVEELRCLVCAWFKDKVFYHNKQTVVFLGFPDSDEGVFHRVAQKLFEWCLGQCPICHGTGYREPDLEWVLEWLWNHEPYIVVSFWQSINGHRCRAAYDETADNSADQNEKILAESAADNYLTAALQVMLAVVKEKK